MNRLLIFFIIALAFIGLADSSYLTSQHYNGGDVVCSLGEHELGDCSTVTSSEYSVIIGIPLALIGVAYYLLLLILGAFMTSHDSGNLRKMFFAVVTAGFISSIYLVYLQLFVISAICVYCMVSAGVTTLLFMSGVYLYTSISNKTGQETLSND